MSLPPDICCLVCHCHARCLIVAACIQGDLDAQPELQTLQKDLQGAKAALHLSNDKLKDSDSTIGRMHDRIKVIQISPMMTACY